MQHENNNTPNLIIYLTHGTKAIVKGLSGALAKELASTDSNRSNPRTTLTVTLNGRFIYQIESIQLPGENKPKVIANNTFSRPGFVQYIKDLNDNHALNNQVMLCCDGNLGHPHAPYVSDELCHLISDGTQAPAGIAPYLIVLFSGTDACIKDSEAYLQGQSSALGYTRPAYLTTGRALALGPSSLKDGIARLLKEPDSFFLGSASKVSEITAASSTKSLDTQQPDAHTSLTRPSPPWHSFFCCLNTKKDVIESEAYRSETLSP